MNTLRGSTTHAFLTHIYLRCKACGGCRGISASPASRRLLRGTTALTGRIVSDNLCSVMRNSSTKTGRSTFTSCPLCCTGRFARRSLAAGGRYVLTHIFRTSMLARGLTHNKKINLSGSFTRSFLYGSNLPVTGDDRCGKSRALSSRVTGHSPHVCRVVSDGCHPCAIGDGNVHMMGSNVSSGGRFDPSRRPKAGVRSTPKLAKATAKCSPVGLISTDRDRRSTIGASSCS